MAAHDAHAEHRSYQHEKLSTAIRGLLPARPAAQELAGAMHEAVLAFRDVPPPPEVEFAWQKLQTLMGRGSSGREQAERLTDTEVHMVVTALWG